MKKSNNIRIKTLVYTAAALTNLLIFNSVWAVPGNTKQLRFHDNGHYYQRIDEPSISWTTASSECKNQGGYLATITTQGEQDFVHGLLVSGGDLIPGYHIGGIKAGNKWQWIIKSEKWNYTNWYKDSDSSGLGKHLSIYNDGVWLSKDNPKEIDGYICEWNYNKNFLNATLIPHDTYNKKDNLPEFAALHQDNEGKNIVEIKDSKTGTLLRKLTFSSGSELSVGMVVLNKTSLAVLIYTETETYIQIKDIKNIQAPVGRLSFLNSNYKPISISVTLDTESDKITVFGIHKTNGKGIMEMRDSKTGKILKSVGF
jgi:Lectin C-type domain